MKSFILRRLLVTLGIACSPQESLAGGTAYAFPAAKQGLTDIYYSTSVPLADRYTELDKFGAGMKIYNLFWGAVENGPVARSVPFRCPGGYLSVPASRAEHDALGYHNYHCYSAAQMAQFDLLLGLDVTHKLQSLAVIWTAPPAYRDPACTGFASGGIIDGDGCVPTDAHMDDYEDYINFLASHYDGSGQGKIAQFIVWNEVNSSRWFDLSPRIDKLAPVTNPAKLALWTQIYADMVRRTRQAVDRHLGDALVNVSLDLNFAASTAISAASPVNIGGRALLDGVWQSLGTDVAWSVAIHPYYLPRIDYGPNIINFRGLSYLSAYQAQKLKALGVNQPMQAPQYWLTCSEQGWFSVPLAERAQNMCAAHDIVMHMPNVTGTTHNFLQGRVPADDQEGLIPSDAGQSLNAQHTTPTYQAYLSTALSTWGKRSDHYCCATLGVGCKTLPTPAGVGATGDVIGWVDGIKTDTSGEPQLTGWACIPTSAFALQVHLYVGGPAGSGSFLGAFMADKPSEPAVGAACSTVGTASLRFAIPLSPFAGRYLSQPLYVHGISEAGGRNPLLRNSGKARMPAR